MAGSGKPDVFQASVGTMPITSASFTYDALNRRTGRTINGLAVRYLYDGMDIVQEIEGNRVTAGYIHGPGVDEPLARISVSGDVWYYHADHQGSIVALTDATGAATTHYSYASFGLPRVSGEAVEQPYMYTGREWDGATGLYYFRARYMEPRTGRFVAQDPIGFAGGDVNLYAYVGNNPMNARDPWGLRPLTSAEKAVLAPYIPARDLDAADVHIGDMPWYSPDWAAGITRGNDIYIRDPDIIFNTPANIALLGHELVHVGQYAEGMTWLSYGWASRNGYWDNPYEVEARKVGKKIMDDLKQKYGDRFPCTAK